MCRAFSCSVRKRPEGINFAMHWSPLPIDVEMDCQAAVESIKAPTVDRSRHAMLVNEVRSILGERDSSIAHISRHQNAVSHRLASFGRLEARTAVWLKSGPANVPQLCLEDLPPH